MGDHVRPVLIIHISRRRPVLSHGQKVCAHVSKLVKCVCVFVCKGYETRSDASSCNMTKIDSSTCPISNTLCASKVGRGICQSGSE